MDCMIDKRCLEKEKACSPDEKLAVASDFSPASTLKPLQEFRRISLHTNAQTRLSVTLQNSAPAITHRRDDS